MGSDYLHHKRGRDKELPKKGKRIAKVNSNKRSQCTQMKKREKREAANACETTADLELAIKPILREEAAEDVTELLIVEVNSVLMDAAVVGK